MTQSHVALPLQHPFRFWARHSGWKDPVCFFASSSTGMSLTGTGLSSILFMLEPQRLEQFLAPARCSKCLVENCQVLVLSATSKPI